MRMSVDNVLLRLYYLTQIKYPVNWLEKNFQQILLKMKNIKNIDECYSIFFPSFAMTLKDKGMKVEEYLNNPPVVNYPDLEGQRFSLNNLANYVNEIWNKIKTAIEKQDKKVIEILMKNKILEREDELPFENIKYSLVHKIFTYKLIPYGNRKGTNVLIMLYIVYLIETGKIGTIFKQEAKKMEEICLFYACESSKNALVNMEEVWDLINYLHNTDIKISFEKYCA